MRAHSRRTLAGAAIALILCALIGAGGAAAASIPLTLHKLVRTNDLVEPTDLAVSPAHPNRLYVTVRAGRIYLVENGEAKLVTDLSALVLDRSPAGEEAMYSIALAPDFDQTGHLYVGYAGNNGDVHVDELTASGDTVPIASRREVMTIPHPNLFHHFLGRVLFGPDGHLYVSTGDGYKLDTPPFSIPGVYSMYLNDLRGKILRIDPADPDGPGGLSYSVPPDNPYASDLDPNTLPEIWSYGFRNPYRVTFDRATGDMVIGDVGDDTNEEIDYAKSPASGQVGGKGLFYGWPCREGFDPSAHAAKPYCASPPAHTDPVFTYRHPSDPGASGCSAIVGGFVVRDRNLGDLYGRLLYGDECTGKVNSLRLSDPQGSDRPEADLGPRPIYDLNSFGEDPLGRVYLVDSYPGMVYRIEPSNAFRFAGVELNKRRGSATLKAKLPTPGKLVLSGKGLVGATVTAKRPGDWGISVRASGDAKRRLEAKGKVRVTADVRFTPKGGTALTKTKSLVLKLDRAR